MQNRLEQLRKRQRDEAFQAEEELRASAKGWGGDMRAEAEPEPQDETPAMVVDEREPYEREMSPVLIDIMSLPSEDRQVEIISELDAVKALVSTYLYFHCYLVIEAVSHSLLNAGLWQTRGLFPNQLGQRWNGMSLLPVAQISSRKRYIERRRRRKWTRKRNSSTLRSLLSTQRPIRGKTNTDHENPDISTAYTLDTNGTSTTRPIMSELTHHLPQTCFSDLSNSTDNSPCSLERL